MCVCVCVRACARLILTLEPPVPCAWALDNRNILVSSWDMSSVDDSGHGAIQPISKEPNLKSRGERSPEHGGPDEHGTALEVVLELTPGHHNATWIT